MPIDPETLIVRQNDRHESYDTSSYKPDTPKFVDDEEFAPLVKSKRISTVSASRLDEEFDEDVGRPLDTTTKSWPTPKAEHYPMHDWGSSKELS